MRKKEKGLKLPVIPWIVRGSWILKQRPSKYDRLTALVVGGATAVAAKSGLLKGLWKLIVAGAVGVAAFLKKIFGRKATA